MDHYLVVANVFEHEDHGTVDDLLKGLWTLDGTAEQGTHDRRRVVVVEEGGENEDEQDNGTVCEQVRNGRDALLAVGTNQRHCIESRGHVLEFRKSLFDIVDSADEQEDYDGDEDKSTPHGIREWYQEYCGIDSHRVRVHSKDELGLESPTLVDGVVFIESVEAIEYSGTSNVRLISGQDSQQAQPVTIGEASSPATGDMVVDTGEGMKFINVMTETRFPPT